MVNANTKLYSTNTSGYRGIYWNKQKNKWRVRVAWKTKTINIGEYIDIKDAVLARDRAYKEFFGDFFNMKGGY